MRLAALTLLALLAVAPAAHASATEPLFGPPALIDARAPFPFTQLTDISCASPSTCVAVGGKIAQFTADAGGAQPPTWSPPAVIAQSDLTAVSCATPDLCVAVTGDAQALRSTDGGATWSAPARIAGVPITGVSCTPEGMCGASDTNGGTYLSEDGGGTWGPLAFFGPNLPLAGISCVTGGVCVAIGRGYDDVWVIHGAGGTPTWTLTHVGPSPAYVAGVSCTENGVCVVVNSLGFASVTSDVRAAGVVWNRRLADGTGDIAFGFVSLRAVTCAENAADPATDTCVGGDSLGSTAIATNVGAPAPDWAVVPTFDTGYVEPTDGLPAGPLDSLACTGEGWCVAGDYLGDVAYARVPRGHPEQTAWSSPPVAFDGHDVMSAVSCAPSGDVCAALDTTGHAVTSIDGGEHWGPAQIVAPLTGGGYGVACVSSGRCVAVMGSSALTWSGGTWSTTQLPALPGLGAADISCTGDGLCVAVDPAGTSFISTDLGASWGWRATGVRPTAISCPRRTLCVAVDSRGLAVRLAGPDADWSAPLVIDGPGPGQGAAALTGVSCTTQAVCVAVDAGGRAVASADSGAHWAAPAAIPGAAALRDVTCAASGLCVAVDAAGRAFYSTQPAAKDPAWAPADTNPVNLAAVSCVGTGLCVGVDVLGNAVAGHSRVAVAALSGLSGVFPPTLLGTATAPQTLTVTNRGLAPLNVRGAALVGSDAGQFGLSGSTCEGAVLAPGESCHADVAFAPASSGAFADAAVAIDSDAASSPDGVLLSGRGLLGPVASLSGGPIAFAATRVGTAGPPHTFTVTNTGDAPLPAAFALSGPDAGQFRLTSACTVVAPGASCDAAVGFAPSTPGLHAATLTVAGQNVAVRGTGATATVLSAVRPAAFARLTRGAHGRITARLRLAGAGRFTLSARLPGRYAYSSRVAARTKGPTSATVKLTPGRRAAAALKRSRTLRVTLTLAFTPAGGKPRTTTATVTVRA